VDSTTSQQDEVAEIKLEILELTAKIADATLISNRQSNKGVTGRPRSHNLDPVLARELRDLLALKTFIESQISEVAAHLDRQWEQHQRSLRKQAK